MRQKRWCWKGQAIATTSFPWNAAFLPVPICTVFLRQRKVVLLLNGELNRQPRKSQRNIAQFSWLVLGTRCPFNGHYVLTACSADAQALFSRCPGFVHRVLRPCSQSAHTLFTECSDFGHRVLRLWSYFSDAFLKHFWSISDAFLMHFWLFQMHLWDFYDTSMIHFSCFVEKSH